MKNLLVPLGSSGNAPNTLQYAVDLANNFNAKVYAVRVYESTRVSGSLKNIDAVFEEDATNELKAIIDKIDRKNIQVSTISVKGSLVDSIEAITSKLEIDLIVSSAKSISTDETLYLGKVPGSLVKDTKIPVLIVPSGYKFKPVSKILMTVKSGNIKDNSKLLLLKDIIAKFSAKLNLVQVITPRSTEEDKNVNEELKSMALTFKTTENATIFQGVLEHLREADPDMLCVMRRKRGFFTRLWQEDAVRKEDFESRIPLLVLKGQV